MGYFYSDDELEHAGGWKNHKYIKRDWVNGRWVYTYKGGARANAVTEATRDAMRRSNEALDDQNWHFRNGRDYSRMHKQNLKEANEAAEKAAEAGSKAYKAGFDSVLAFYNGEYKKAQDLSNAGYDYQRAANGYNKIAEIKDQQSRLQRQLALSSRGRAAVAGRNYMEAQKEVKALEEIYFNHTLTGKAQKTIEKGKNLINRLLGKNTTTRTYEAVSNHDNNRGVRKGRFL